MLHYTIFVHNLSASFFVQIKKKIGKMLQNKTKSLLKED